MNFQQMLNAANNKQEYKLPGASVPAMDISNVTAAMCSLIAHDLLQGAGMTQGDFLNCLVKAEVNVRGLSAKEQMSLVDYAYVLNGLTRMASTLNVKLPPNIKGYIETFYVAEVEAELTPY